MSDAPCTGCRQTDNGRLFYVYVQHFPDDEFTKRRARLCRDCLAENLPPLIESSDHWDGQHWLSEEEWLALNTPRQLFTDATRPADHAVLEQTSRKRTSSSTTPGTKSKTPSARRAG
jgi:hypothetical protein